MAELLAVVPPAVAPLVAAVGVLVLPRRIAFAFATLVTALVVPQITFVPAGTHLAAPVFGFDAVPYAVDSFSRTVGLAIGFVGTVATVYASGTDMPRTQAATALVYVAASLGAVFVGDWLTLVICWEVMAVAATLLLWEARGASRAAGYRYAIYHEIGALWLVAAVLLQYAATGTFLFEGGFAAGLPSVLALLGIGLNVGVLGLHVWLVDAYPRPHVAASVFMVALTTKVGVYALARAFPDGHVGLSYLGGAMVLFGVTMAILQTEMRRLLTYHVVSQVGYMVAGVGIGTGLAVAGAFAHLFNNVLYKCLLFMVAGVIASRTDRSDLKRLGGLAGEMPRTFAVFLAAAFAITGLPGFNGFVSKGMVVDSAQGAGLDGLWWVLLVGGVGTVVSFVKFGYYAFFHGRATTPTTDASVSQLLPMVALAVPCVLLGLFVAPLFSILPGDPWVAKPFARSQFVKAGATFLAGIVTFVVVRTPLASVGRVPDLDAVYRPAGRALVGAAVSTVADVGAAIERASERLVGRVVTAVDDPGRFLERIATNVPGIDATSVSVTARNADIGLGVLLVVLTLALVLFALFL